MFAQMTKEFGGISRELAQSLAIDLHVNNVGVTSVAEWGVLAASSAVGYQALLVA